jgi:ferredoxin--NADP+ reductase
VRYNAKVAANEEWSENVNKITHKRALNSAVMLMKIEAPEIAKRAQAGQFIILRIDEKGERIPLTVADTDGATGEVTIMFQVVGATTRLLSQMQEGDFLMDFVGPLGMPTHYGNATKVCVVGGGVGCAIAYPQAKALHSLGIPVDVVAGFRSRDIVILEDEFQEVCDNLYITTDDGSYGIPGFVTTQLEKLINEGRGYDLVIAIGPIPMMKFVSAVTKKYAIKTIVSLNPVMVDGTGMCGGCRVTVGGQTKFACVDGPDFDGHAVDYDELMLRNSFYKGIETQKDEHVCRIGLEGGRHA